MQQEEKAVSFELFVNGTLMRGLELHGNLEGAAQKTATWAGGLSLA